MFKRLAVVAGLLAAMGSAHAGNKTGVLSYDNDVPTPACPSMTDWNMVAGSNVMALRLGRQMMANPNLTPEAITGMMNTVNGMLQMANDTQHQLCTTAYSGQRVSVLKTGVDIAGVPIALVSVPGGLQYIVAVDRITFDN